MNKILALWAVPRSCSTAFTVMMEQRGDFVIRNESFEGAAYKSNERIFDRQDYVGAAPNYTEILNNLLSTAKTRKIFIKDHAYYILHIANEQFLDYFNHSFLIRDPAKALPSFFSKWPDITMKEAGYKDISELFDRVTEHTGKVPPLLDGDDLVKNPHMAVKSYCEHVGIPYVKEAMQWLPRHKVSKEQDTPLSNAIKCSMWHEYLGTTSGFEENRASSYPEVHENDKLNRLYDECMPYYEKLYKHRIIIDGDNNEG